MPVAETSRRAFEQIVPRLSARQRLILSALETWQGTPPTAYELFMRLRAQGAVRDLNDVRPRLTELKADGRVLDVGTRRCTITGRSAHTWRPALRVPRQPQLWHKGLDDVEPPSARQGRLT